VRIFNHGTKLEIAKRLPVLTNAGNCFAVGKCAKENAPRLFKKECKRNNNLQRKRNKNEKECAANIKALQGILNLRHWMQFEARARLATKSR
jgi:hypothetical protein